MFGFWGVFGFWKLFLDYGAKGGTTATSAELQLMASECGAKRARTATGIEGRKPAMGAIGGQLQLKKKKYVVKNNNLVEHKQSFSYL